MLRVHTRLLARGLRLKCFCLKHHPYYLSLASLLVLTANLWPQSTSAVPLVTIGSPDATSDSSVVFGRIVDIASGDDGTLFVLDQQSLGEHLFAFSRTGQALDSIGTRGRGPGELLAPTELVLAERGRLFVLDVPNHRLNEYTFGGTKFSSARSFRIPLEVSPSSFCMLNAALVVMAYDAGRLFHIITLDGARTASFGEAWLSSHPVLTKLDSGIVICNADSRRIYAAAYEVPYVRAYASNGELLWADSIAGFAPLEISVVGNAGMMQRVPEEGADIMLSLVELPGDELLLQFGHFTEDVDEVTEIVSVFLDGETGRELGRTAELPRIHHVTDSHAFGYSALPYPQVLGYSSSILKDVR